MASVVLSGRESAPGTSLSAQIRAIELAEHDVSRELRDLRGRWSKTPGASGAVRAAKGSAAVQEMGNGLTLPPRSRLVNPRGKYHDPADHPFFRAHPVSAGNVEAVYGASSPGERAQGMRWYSDGHTVAKAIASGDAVKGAGLLSAYSPQINWPQNMYNAARTIELGRALGPGDGQIMGMHQRAAQKILDGRNFDETFPSPKTNAFAKLLAYGGDPPGEKYGQVVVDRHAVSVAIGKRVSVDELEDAPLDKPRFYAYVADTYREAARNLSRKYGIPIAPHQVQAVTWLHQQAANQAFDVSSAGRLGRGRATRTKRAWETWSGFTRSHHIPVHSGTTALVNTITGQILELASWQDEPRDPSGKWINLGHGIDSMLEETFKPARLEAVRVPHPRSGYEVPKGIGRQVFQPQSGEGPAKFILRDYGDPADPSYNSLKYMGGNKIGEEPIRHVYRGMSQAEWDQAQRRGYIESDRRGVIADWEGTNAAADPRDAASYLPRHGTSVIAKIAVQPEDQWFTIHADEYLRTRKKIPLSRVEKTAPFRRVGKYAELQVPAPMEMANRAWEHELRDRKGRWTRGGTGTVTRQIKALDPYYNTVPETRGVSRTKSTYEQGGGAGRARADAERLAAFRREGGGPVTYREITADEARGNSRAVTSEEFQHLAALGDKQLNEMKRDRGPLTGLYKNWHKIRDDTWAEAGKSWGGATIDAHTGIPLPQGADKYALSVKPDGMHTVSIPDTASREEFDRAMNSALAQFQPVLQRRGFYLGVFHDDDNHRIDIDPVAVVDSVPEVETLGAFTHAIGGAYHFRSGDGFWPPHVGKTKEMATPGTVHFAGPGQWRSQAVDAQAGDPSADVLEDFETAGEEPPPALSNNLTSQIMDLAGRSHFNPKELRDPHGRWSHGGGGITQQLNTGEEYPGYFSERILLFWRSEKDPEVKQHLNAASGHYEADDFDGAVEELRKASHLANEHGDNSGWYKYGSLADNLEVTATGRWRDVQALKKFGTKAAPAVARMLGGGHSGWNGQVTLDDFSTNPGVLAEMRWSGTMNVREDKGHALAQIMGSKGAISDPEAPDVILHELVHSVIQRDYRDGQVEYQDPGTATIEEGFTELGAVWHAPEFFDAMEIGDRPTEIIAVEGGHIRETGDKNKIYEHQGELRDITEYAGSIEGGSAGAYNELKAAEREFFSPDMSMDEVINHLSKAGYLSKDRRLRGDISKLLQEIDAIPARASHATLSEYAQRLADPARIESGDVWGHYPQQTRAAMHWVMEIANTEGHKDYTPGSPGFRRLVELSDEINREGADRKLRVMAQQVLRADHVHTWKLTPNQWGELEAAIRDNWIPRAESGDDLSGEAFMLAARLK